MTSLSKRGYSILIEALDKFDYESVQRDLTVYPVIPFGAPKSISQPNVIFFETNTRIYIPKFYGVTTFGVPEVIKIMDGLPINISFSGSLRPEQQEPVNAILSACESVECGFGGILNVFCGGGKTTMAIYAMAKISKKTLIIVHKDFLLEQWLERIGQFVPGARTGIIKAQKCITEKCDVVIASLQSLSMKEYDPSIFDEFGLVIIDEVHHMGAEVFSRALRKVSAIKRSIGLSATIDRKDGLEKIFKWYLGDVVFSAEKRQDNVLVEIAKFPFSKDIKYSDLPTISIAGKTRQNTARMINNICSFEPRNVYILQQIERIFRESRRKMLILSDRRTQLEHLAQMINETLTLTCGLYLGGMKSSALAECEKKDIILATYAIASEGYDQKGLDILLLASPRTDVIQSVGRILRDKQEDRKTIPTVIDIIDAFGPFVGQASKRKAFYKSSKFHFQNI